MCFRMSLKYCLVTCFYSEEHFLLFLEMDSFSLFKISNCLYLAFICPCTWLYFYKQGLFSSLKIFIESVLKYLLSPTCGSSPRHSLLPIHFSLCSRVTFSLFLQGLKMNNGKLDNLDNIVYQFWILTPSFWGLLQLLFSC